MSGAPWRAALDGHDAELARAIVARIQAALRVAIERCDARPAETPFQAMQRAVVDRGAAGWALLHHFAGDAASAEDCLARAAAAMSEHESAPALFRGFVGIAWAHGVIQGGDVEDFLAGVDDTLLEFVAGCGPEVRIALLDGLVGLGTYALARWPRPAARQLLAAVSARIASRALNVAQGMTWHHPHGLPNTYDSPNGTYDLGTANGASGAVALLGAACARGEASHDTRRVLEGAVTFMLACRQPSPSGQMPILISLDHGARVARQGWCYGDSASAHALLVAAHALGRDDWKAAAIDLAAGCGSVSAEAGEVQDANFCHGAGGIAHVLHRVALATGDARVAAAATTWYQRALALHTSAANTTWRDDAVWPDDPSDAGLERDLIDVRLLYGETGLGLALLAALGQDPTPWDRLFLVDPAAPIA